MGGRGGPGGGGWREAGHGLPLTEAAEHAALVHPPTPFLPPPALESTMRQVNHHHPAAPLSLYEGTGTWRRLRACWCPRRFGRGGGGGLAADAALGLGGRRATRAPAAAGGVAARRCSATCSLVSVRGGLCRPACPLCAQRSLASAPPFPSPALPVRSAAWERPVPVEPSLRGHVEAPSVGEGARRFPCAAETDSRTGSVREKGSFGGVTVKGSRSVLPYAFGGDKGIGGDQRAMRLNLAWLEVPSSH